MSPCHCQPQKHEHWKLPCCCNRLLSNPCVNNDKNNRHKSFGLPTKMPRFVPSDPSPKVVLLLLRHAVPPAGLLLQAPLFRCTSPNASLSQCASLSLQNASFVSHLRRLPHDYSACSLDRQNHSHTIVIIIFTF